MSQSEESNFYIILFSLFGVLIAAYSYYVKKQVQKKPHYRALCDINEHMSCTRVLTSP